MKKTILKYGLISGTISAILMLFTGLTIYDLGFDNGQIIGYASMLISFSFVFLGIRSYRENDGQGLISFGKAFKAGILITLISCFFYVISWLFVYYNFLPDFMDQYIAYLLETMKKEGASLQEIKQSMNEMQKYRSLYNNPFFNALVTFAEPFPVGLLITLISSFILKRTTVKNS